MIGRLYFSEGSFLNIRYNLHNTSESICELPIWRDDAAGRRSKAVTDCLQVRILMTR